MINLSCWRQRNTPDMHNLRGKHWKLDLFQSYIYGLAKILGIANGGEIGGVLSEMCKNCVG